MFLLWKGMRGWVKVDPWHVGWGASRKAAADADIWVDILEVAVAQNARKAPHKLQAFLGQIKSCRDDYFSGGRDETDLLIRFYVPLITWDEWRRTGNWPADYDTPAHHRRVFLQLKNSKIPETTGQFVTMMRFYSFYDAMEEEGQGFLYHWWEFVFHCNLVGIFREWWPTLDAFVAQQTGRLVGLEPDQAGGAVPKAHADAVSIAWHRAEKLPSSTEVGALIRSTMRDV